MSRRRYQRSLIVIDAKRFQFARGNEQTWHRAGMVFGIGFLYRYCRSP